MKAKTIYVTTAALLLIAAGGCKEDDIYVSDEYNRSINAAAPVVKVVGTARGMMDRWMENTKWEVDEDGLLQLVFLNRDSASATEALNLKDINFAIDQTAVPKAGETMTSVVVNTDSWVSVEGQKFDYIKFSGGRLYVNSPAKTEAGSTAKATLTMMGKGGKAIRNSEDEALSTEWLLAEGTNAELDLTGYEVEPYQGSDGTYFVKVSVEIENVTGETDVNVSGSFSDLKVAAARGYFGNHYMLSDRSYMTVSVFDEMDFAQDIEFYNPSVDITLSSTIGVPLQWQVSDVTYYDGHGKKNGTLAAAAAYNFTQQSYADYTATGQLEEQVQTVHYDRDNSNIYDAVNAHPRTYDFTQTLIANPDGDAEGQTNFVTEDSYFKSEVRTTLPLWVRIKKWSFVEKTDLDFKDIFEDENIDYVDTVKIKIVADNGLPVKEYAQGFFTANGVTVGQLFDDYTVITPTAQLDENDLVTGRTHKETVKVLTQEDVKRYYDLGVDKLVMDCYITTEDTEDRFVKIFSHYSSQWKVSVEIASSVKK